MKACPVCKKAEKFRGSHPKGFWEKKMLSLILLRPFRCSSCGRRFYRFSLRNTVRHGGRRKLNKEGDEKRFSGFLEPKDPGDFDGFIGKIREAEKHTDRNE